MPAAAQRLNGGLNVRIGLHIQKAVHELVRFFFARVQFREPGCEDQRLARDRPEIGIASHRIAQPAIFELPESPGVDQLGTFAGK